jgi:hypothetical protein
MSLSSNEFLPGGHLTMVAHLLENSQAHRAAPHLARNAISWGDYRGPIIMAATRIPVSVARRYPPYLLARQIAALRRLSEVTDIPVQFHIRMAVDEYLASQKKKRPRARGRSNPEA